MQTLMSVFGSSMVTVLNETKDVSFSQDIEHFKKYVKYPNCPDAQEVVSWCCPANAVRSNISLFLGHVCFAINEIPINIRKQSRNNESDGQKEECVEQQESEQKTEIKEKKEIEEKKDKKGDTRYSDARMCYWSDPWHENSPDDLVYRRLISENDPAAKIETDLRIRIASLWDTVVKSLIDSSTVDKLFLIPEKPLEPDNETETDNYVQTVVKFPLMFGIQGRRNPKYFLFSFVWIRLIRQEKISCDKIQNAIQATLDQETKN